MHADALRVRRRSLLCCHPACVVAVAHGQQRESLSGRGMYAMLGRERPACFKQDMYSVLAVPSALVRVGLIDPQASPPMVCPPPARPRTCRVVRFQLQCC